MANNFHPKQPKLYIYLQAVLASLHTRMILEQRKKTAIKIFMNLLVNKVVIGLLL